VAVARRLREEQEERDLKSTPEQEVEAEREANELLNRMRKLH
jgi:hypothetical protein